MKKNVALMIGIVVGAVVASMLVRTFIRTQIPPAFDEALMKVASDLNKNLPMMVDAATRLDSTTALPGNKFNYFYTIMKEQIPEFDPAKLKESLTPIITETYKTDPKMKTFRENKTELHYSYKDEKGTFLFEIVVSPKDFGA